MPLLLQDEARLLQRLAGAAGLGRELVVDLDEDPFDPLKDGHAALEQGQADAGRFGSDFSWVVEVRLNPDLARRGEQIFRAG